MTTQVMECKKITSERVWTNELKDKDKENKCESEIN